MTTTALDELRRLKFRIPYRRRIFAALAVIGLLSALAKLPAHWREWVPPALPFATGLFVFAATMVIVYGLDRLPGIPRGRRRFVALLRPALGLGFRFGVGFLVIGVVLRLVGIPVTLWRAYSDGAAFVRVFVLVLTAGFAGGTITGHWLRRAAAALHFSDLS